MNVEMELAERALSNGPEAMNLSRVRLAAALRHEEPVGEFTLKVYGGLGSFSVGSRADLLCNGLMWASTYELSSWVYLGKEITLTEARAWASDWISKHPWDMKAGW